MQIQGSGFLNSGISQVDAPYRETTIQCQTGNQLMRCADIFGDKGTNFMNAFIYSLVAIAVVTVIAAVIFDGLEFSAADVFQLKDSVRL